MTRGGSRCVPVGHQNLLRVRELHCGFHRVQSHVVEADAFETELPINQDGISPGAGEARNISCPVEKAERNLKTPSSEPSKLSEVNSGTS